MFGTICERPRQYLGIVLWQRPNDDTIKLISFTSRYLNDAESNYSIGEIKIPAVKWGFEKFRFPLYGELVHLYTDHQVSESKIKRNRGYQKNNARLTRWLDGLEHFDNSIKCMAGKILALTDYSSRHPTEEVTAEET